MPVLLFMSYGAIRPRRFPARDHRSPPTPTMSPSMKPNALLLPLLFLPLPLTAAQGVLPPAATGDLLVSSSVRNRLLRLTHAGHQLAEIPLPAVTDPRGI